LAFFRDPEKGNVRGSLSIFLVLLVSLSGVGLLLWRYIKGPSSTQLQPQPTPIVSASLFQGDPVEATEKLYKAVNDRLEELDLLKLRVGDVSKKFVTVQGKEVPAYSEAFRLPLIYSESQLAGILEKVAQTFGAQMRLVGNGTEKGPVGCRFYSEFYFNSQWIPLEVDYVQHYEPTICLIIDDGGYQKGEALRHLYALKVPVTVSIIPNVEFSKNLAEEFPGHGVEVMCHMPMEGHEKGAVGGNYKALLKKGMDPDVAKADVEQALDDLPHCRGLNNHMGSVATEDPDLIRGVCEALRLRRMFIIDSRTTPKSVVERVARKAGVAVASRNIFLDNIETPDAILKQLEQTAAYAKKHGLAVAIGHFKVGTLKTLEEAAPLLEAKGFRFVYASEVVKGN